MITPLIGIVMGSDSDLPVMEAAANVCKDFGIEYELTVVSAHRTPMRMFEYAQGAKDRGLQVIIAGAGGAAHLPGMIASITTLPVIGVPIKSSNSIDGWDSILSILQMPNGIPVATVALNAANNAGLLAVKILAISNKELSQKVQDYKDELQKTVLKKVELLVGNGWPNHFDEK
ncbi:MAG: 5-(carboxyamino)imidazole ribonucleotide mutase [Chitinophagaceae bacterium]|nr:5-(carboxyamino)imidazole ribonucleotide mutase [Chitinophagaceae bacterium]